MSHHPITQPLPVDIRNWSFRGMDCTGWDFSGRDIRGCDFRNAQLSGANFSGAIAGSNRKQKFTHVTIMISAIITGFAIGAFLVGVSASIAGTAAFVFWKKRPVVFDFALTGIFLGAFLGASIKIISALSHGRTAYAIGAAAIAFFVMALFWSYEAKKAFTTKIVTTFQYANLEGTNFSNAILENCNFDQANLNDVTGFPDWLKQII